MANRTHQKAAARRAKIGALQRHQAATRRRRRLVTLVGIVAVAAGIAAVAASRPHDKGVAAAASRPLPAPGALPGLQTSRGPWEPEYDHLLARNRALHFPPNGDESYHIHALLHVYVNGQPLDVPDNIGIVPGVVETPLHTHDRSGVIHIEAGHEFPFRLGDVFAVWGVAFTNTQLGGYTNRGADTVQVYVNGKPISDPDHYVLKARDNIVVAYGAAGSFPTTPPTDALPHA